MKKIKMIVAYDGTDFHGFQSQPGLRTVQGELEKALSRLTGQQITIYGSGRTDAGVHAHGQVIHFETTSPIPNEKYSYILRRALPRDLVVRSVEDAPMDFHAQKSARWKTYRYQIETSPVPELMTRRFRTYRPRRVDLEKMRVAASYVMGTHDFTSFCSVMTHVENKVRTIYDFRIEEEGGVLTFWVTGNGFLYNMVRILVGTIFDIGLSRWPTSRMQTMLEARDRKAAGLTFPPEGLMLWEVGYEPWVSSAKS